MKSILDRLTALVLSPVENWKFDPIEMRTGIHVSTDYFGKGFTLISDYISPDTVGDALWSLDWENGFVGLIVVTAPGVCLEVSGSLDPEHGLSSCYINRKDGVESVIAEAPESVEHMQEILLDFLGGDGNWMARHSFG